tara:strand:+ start:8223 stop:8930 length:708 start_codon:yes stop_codon:yes gene_type:complete
MIKALGSIAIPCPLFTDCAFWGVGDDDTTLSIGIERKKIGDLVQCIYDGRLIQQAQLAKENGIDVFVVLVEGRIRSNPDDGLLEIPVWGINPRTLRRAEVWQPVKPAITYSRLDQYLTELDYLAGFIIKRSEDVKETAAVVKALWDNFQTPPSKHGSLHQIYTQPNQGSVLLVRPNLVRRVAKELKGVGWERSQAVADRFKSVRELVGASVDDWRAVDGIGKVTAEKVVRELSGK